MNKLLLGSILGGFLSLASLGVHADEVAPCTLKQVGFWSGGPAGSGPVFGCFKDAANMTSQIGYIRYNGNTCVEASAFAGYRVEGCANPTFYKITVASSSSSSSKPASSSAASGWPQLPAGARILFSGQCSSYGCLDSTQKCSSNQGTYTHAPYPAQDYICYK